MELRSEKMQLIVRLRAAERALDVQRERGGSPSDGHHAGEAAEASEQERDFGWALSAAEERVASMVVDVLGTVEERDDPFGRVVMALGDELKTLRVAAARQAEDARKVAEEAARVAEAQRAELYAELAVARSRADAEARALQEARDAHHVELQDQKFSAAEAILRAEKEVEQRMAKKVDRLTKEILHVSQRSISWKLTAVQI